MLAEIVEEQGLGATLALVVTRACTNWIDVAPISFGLRVFAGVAIYLTCGRLENSTAQPLGEAKHVDGTMHGGLSGLHRIMLIVDRRGGARKVPDLVCFYIQRERYVVTNELKARVVIEFLDVPFRAGKKVVDTEYLVPAL